MPIYNEKNIIFSLVDHNNNKNNMTWLLTPNFCIVRNANSTPGVSRHGCHLTGTSSAMSEFRVNLGYNYWFFGKIQKSILYILVIIIVPRSRVIVSAIYVCTGLWILENFECLKFKFFCKLMFHIQLYLHWGNANIILKQIHDIPTEYCHVLFYLLSCVQFVSFQVKCKYFRSIKSILHYTIL